ncbi:Nif3-like dinuclear metal center hexameric protein [Pedobacter aquatilis]|uniref:Nif3-like dinuclear metal center hexameric protein n=1 Tax=Pedobacter aquatilis TaxID=351343 RepID=UPI002930734B|nr:Nif3-like dinuclear metal center hexameric protein [Pedobacter aquatilis]
MKNSSKLLPLKRRNFIALTGTATASIILSPILTMAESSKKQVTVKDIMNTYINQLATGPIANTVDTLKSGSPDLVVTGIVTCMFATIEVINKAIAIGANFIVAHEPTFYNHQDATKFLQNDEVYKFKSELLKKHNIAVWRNHDNIHSIQPDGVWESLVEKLGWEKQLNNEKRIYNFNPSISFKNLITALKTKLEIPALRYIGDMNQQCSKVLLMVGAAGGQRQIEAIGKFNPDVLVTGEIAEWETAEYVRDARASGKKLSLIILGHIASEEWGSKYMEEWLKNKFPDIKTTFIRTGASLSII